MPRTPPTVTINKGAHLLGLAEQVRISPAPKLGGACGPHLRFLSVGRGQSTLTDLEVGSLTVLRRVIGLPLLHRLWCEPEGYALGYTKRRRIGSPSELYFLDPAGRLITPATLPDAISEVAYAPGGWYVGCRDGALYAFSLQGRLLWQHRIPYEPRSCSLASPLLETFTQPYLFVGAMATVLIVAEGRGLYGIDPLGRRIWTSSVPGYQNHAGAGNGPGALPTREQTLATLGLSECDTDLGIPTGYLRLALDTCLNAGFLKQVELYEVPDAGTPEWDNEGEGDIELMMGGLYRSSDCRALACSPTRFCVGTQEGVVHVFDRNASLMQSFQVGDAPVSQLVVDAEGPRAAYSGGRLTLLRHGRVTGSVTLPEYFANLTLCGETILAWRWQTAWLVAETGRVVWSATMERRITSAFGEADGFCLLAGQLASFRRPVEELLAAEAGIAGDPRRRGDAR